MFEELQAGLGPVWRLNRPGVGVDVVVVLPSYVSARPCCPTTPRGSLRWSSATS
jgi:hypothetical protein